jgi:hypothetical protein
MTNAIKQALKIQATAKKLAAQKPPKGVAKKSRKEQRND